MSNIFEAIWNYGSVSSAKMTDDKFSINPLKFIYSNLSARTTCELKNYFKILQKVCIPGELLCGRYALEVVKRFLIPSNRCAVIDTQPLVRTINSLISCENLLLSQI